MLLGPTLAEHIADHGDLALGAKLANYILNADQLLETGCVESCGIGPEIEHGIDLALLRLLGEQRRSTEDLLGLGPEIEICGPERIGDDQEPTLVERAASDAKLLALEIRQGLD